MKKYLFFDIDGTLISHTKRNYIPESALKTLEMLKENGHMVFLATGRGDYLARDIMKRVDVHNAVCEGGNQVILDDKTISVEYMDQDLLKKTVKECDELDLGWAVSCKIGVRVDTSSLRFKQNIADVKKIYEINYDENFDVDKCEVIYRILLENIPEKIAKLSYIKNLGYMYYSNSPIALIEPDDKMKGIKKVMELIGGNFEDVIVFGDGLNDIKMFEKAPYSVAMGNACEELKKISDYVTSSTDEDGIYKACKYLNLI